MKPRVTVGRRYRFAASHRLHSLEFSEAENRDVYGKCNNPYGHGHNYVVEVHVSGVVHPQTGVAVDLQALDEVVHSCVVRPFGHRDLNRDVAEFAELPPTSENVARVIEQRLQSAWPFQDARLERVRLEETPRNSVDLVASRERPATSNRMEHELARKS